MAMTELLDFLLMLSAGLALFAAPVAVLTLIGKIFKIKAITDALKW